MKVIKLQVLELRLAGREQFFDATDVLVHGAADIHQQQHFHVVVALGHHLDVEPAGIGCGRADGVVKIEFFSAALAGKFAQPTQRDFDVAGAEFLRVVVVFVGALVPDFDGTSVTAFFLTDADALRIETVRTKWRRAACADPFAASFVAFFLFFKAFFERLHEFVPTHLLDLGFVFSAELKLQVFAQPFKRNVFGEVGHHFDAFEVRREGAVKLVVMLFVFHQHAAAQVIKIVNLVSPFA